MNPIRKTYCRAVQKSMYLAMRLMRFNVPTQHHSYRNVIQCFVERKLKNVLIISGRHVSKKEEVATLIRLFDEEGIHTELYTEITPDPTLECVESLYSFYEQKKCDGILAIGGGSVIDSSKALQCKILYPKKNPTKLKGVLKVRHKPPYLFVIPTTAGTGSEATACLVLTDEKKNDKFAISDPCLIPKDVLLDGNLLIGQSQESIAITSMDAFSHAIEAYLSLDRTKYVEECSLKAMKLIKENIIRIYQDIHDKKARDNMMLASFYAGVSFTRAYVGYVHALAHAIGGEYHLPHGYCIAILLPYVLRAYGTKAEERLSALSIELGIGNEGSSRKDNSDKVICFIERLNEELKIPSSFEGQIKEEDYEKLAIHASREANPLYPVIRELDEKELLAILNEANKGN